MRSFKNQVAIITGAASGIGAAIAARLSEEGVKLALLDQNEEKLQQLVKNFPPDTKTYILDITNENLVKETIDTIQQHFGTIDILVNSAGITGQTNIQSHNTNTGDIRKVFEVNYYGSYFTSKYVLPSDADSWKIQPEDIGQIVADLLQMPSRTLPSKIEVRPSKPSKS